jgi:CRP/FNR family transcriptional regulator
MEAIEDLAQRMVMRGFERNMTLIPANEPFEGAFLVLSGRVEANVFRESRAATLHVARAGDWVGSDALLGADHGVASWIATEPTMTLALSRGQLRYHLEAHPQTSLGLARDLSRRLREADETIALFALSTIEARFVRAVVRLAREEGVPHAGGFELRRPPTQQSLADRIGTRRETVSRIVAQLLRSGHLIRRGSYLLVTPALLAAEHGLKAPSPRP